MKYGKRSVLSILGSASILITAISCSGSQTNKAGKKVLQGDVTQEYDSTQTNKLILEGGDLKGTEVSIPAGSLAEGAVVDVREGQAQFGSNAAVSSGSVTPASKPLAVTASSGAICKKIWASWRTSRTGTTEATAAAPHRPIQTLLPSTI